MSDDLEEADRFCHNCAFFAYLDGECRRYAPQSRSVSDDAVASHKQIALEGNDDRYRRTTWPAVDQRDWCGEWTQTADEPQGGWMVQGVRHSTEAKPE